MISLLYGCRNSYATRTPSYSQSLYESTAHLFIYIFTPVGSDIDVTRLKFLQAVYGVKKLTRTTTFQGWQDLKRERPTLLIIY